MEANRRNDRRDDPMRELLGAGIALGVGMGGFLDGILFHQIFQLHQMLSAKLPPDTLENVERNMTWDGVFHLFTWALTLLGVVLLWRAARRVDVFWHGGALLGSGLAGWGLFNLLEGLLSHHLLGLHHVVERLGLSVWDWIFLASGPILMGLGALVARADLRGMRRGRRMGAAQPQH
jgi:uncharacterized membrane protein